MKENPSQRKEAEDDGPVPSNNPFEDPTSLPPPHEYAEYEHERNHDPNSHFAEIDEIVLQDSMMDTEDRSEMLASFEAEQNRLTLTQYEEFFDKRSQESNSDLQAALRQSRSQYFAKSGENQLLNLKVQSLQSENAALVEQIRYSQANAMSNSYSRKDQGKSIHLADITATSRASLLVRSLYSCRCTVACRFKFGALETPSPTEINTWSQLRQMRPHLKDEDLQILSQRHVPGVCHKPTDEALKITSKCRTMHLWVHDIGWHKDLELFHSNYVEKFFGQNALENAYKASIFAAPGVKESETPLHGQNVIYLPEDGCEEKILECIERRHGVQIVILILPFSVEEEDAKVWEECIRAVPEHIHVLIVPGFSRIPDFDLAEAYALIFKNFSRNKGNLVKIVPDERVKSHQNRSLISLNGHNATNYWEVIGDIIKDRENVIWPRFAVHDPDKVRHKDGDKNQSEGTTTPRVNSAKPSTPMKTWTDRRAERQADDVGPTRRVLQSFGRGNASVSYYRQPPPNASKTKYKKY